MPLWINLAKITGIIRARHKYNPRDGVMAHLVPHLTLIRAQTNLTRRKCKGWSESNSSRRQQTTTEIPWYSKMVKCRWRKRRRSRLTRRGGSSFAVAWWYHSSKKSMSMWSAWSLCLMSKHQQSQLDWWAIWGSRLSARAYKAAQIQSRQ